MLLAEIAWPSWTGDAFKTVALLAAGGFIAHFGERLLQRHGLIHRFAEQLWHERLKVYQELVSSANVALEHALRYRRQDASEEKAEQNAKEFEQSIERA